MEPHALPTPGPPSAVRDPGTWRGVGCGRDLWPRAARMPDMRVRHAAIAAGTSVVLAGAVGAAGGGSEAPERVRLRLASTPQELVEACDRLATRKHVRVLCPHKLPVSPAGGTVRPGRPLCRPSRTYMVEYRVSARDGAYAGRVLVGAGLRSFRLDDRAPGDAWIKPDGVPPALRLRPGGTVIARATVHKRPALVVAAPAGGLHGGHVLVLWNEDGHGYLVSVGGQADRTELARAAIGVAASTVVSKLEPRVLNRDVSRLVEGTPLGRSARGRTIRGTRFGVPAARRRIAVFGCLHGDECAGIRVVEQVLQSCPGGDYDLLAIPNLNPDGRRLGTRLNGRGVDLNRNFGSDWRRIGRRGDPEHSGPRPFSEPETRVAARAIRSFRPDVTIWFHQHRAAPLVRAWGQSVAVARRFARLARLPFAELPWPAGTAPNWQNHRFPGTSSFVVELPFGPVSRRMVSRQVQAVLRLALERG